MNRLGCNGHRIISDLNEGEYYCPNCSIVTEQVFDYSVHWYEEEGTSYVHTAFSKANKGLGEQKQLVKAFRYGNLNQSHPLLRSLPF